MSECWLGFHTLDVEMAIDDLKEIYRESPYSPNFLSEPHLQLRALDQNLLPPEGKSILADPFCGNALCF